MYRFYRTVNPFTFCLLLLLLLVTSLSSCRKEGCKDINGVNYDTGADIHDGLCTYRYLNDITLVRVPFTRQAGTFWDIPNADPLGFPGEEYPDLKFYVKRKNSTYWEYQTAVEFDITNTPVRWNISDFGSSHLLMGTEYEYKLVDVDEKVKKFSWRAVLFPRRYCRIIRYCFKTLHKLFLSN
jgi:hypothetical protein